MKMLVASLLLVSAFVTACSSGGGGGGGAAPGGPVDYKPNEKPANAMSKADVDVLFKKMKASEAFIPSDAAIFRTVLSGASAQQVSNNERNAAVAKLNVDGQNFLTNIQGRCVVTDAQVTGDNQQPQLNVPLKKTGFLSTRGTGCPYVINEQIQFEQTITSATQEGGTAVMSQTSNKKSEVLDAGIMAKSGLKSMTQSMTLNGTASASKTTATTNVAGSGQMEIVMADGDKVAGPLYIKMNVVNGVMDMQTLFEGSTSKGALRMVIQMNTTTGMKAFINGEEVSPETIGGLPQMVKP